MSLECCNVVYASTKSLRRHQKQKHGLVVPKPCTACDVVLASAAELSAHVNAVHMDESGKFPCTTAPCVKSFDTLRSLLRHTVAHVDEYPFACTEPDCGAVFKLSQDLVRHARFHTKDYQHFCETCDKGFVTKGELVQHAAVHSDERPFACPEEGCESKYKDLKGLEYHMLSSHSGERLVKCDQCDHRAFTSSALGAHKRTAHGVQSRKRVGGATDGPAKRRK